MSQWVNLQIQSHEAMIAAWKEIQIKNLNNIKSDN
jgi:hypothetical protein